MEIVICVHRYSMEIERAVPYRYRVNVYLCEVVCIYILRTMKVARE
jgi:hypothetical protein